MHLLATLLAGALGSLQFTPCTLADHTGLSSQPAECARLPVAENPADAGGTQIELHVAIVRARDSSRRDHAVAILAGGPGQSAAEFYAGFASAFGVLARNHDLLIVDQRGTGRSHALDCELPVAFQLGGSALDEPIRDAATQCLAQLDGDPRYYTTSIAVRDLEAVREATGYRQLDLYGASYGTRVALHYLRRYPDRVRNLVLDGVVPPQAALGLELAQHAQRALDLIFARCAAEPGCRDAFPTPAKRFAELHEQLATAAVRVELADPIDARPRELDFAASDLGAAVRLLSYSAETASLLPLLIEDAAGANVAPLAAQALIAGSGLIEGLSLGMHNAVVCSEDVPFYDPPSIDRAALAQTYLGSEPIDSLIELCSVWPRGSVDEDFKKPLAVSAPTLLLSGQADPITPPDFAEQVAAQLRDARHLVLTGQGHGQLHRGCMADVVADFIETGRDSGLDHDCLMEIVAPPFFVDFAGPPP